MQACMVFLLNGFGSTNLMLICSQFLLFANGACMGIFAGIVVVYTGIEKNSMDDPAPCSTIVAFFY